MSLSWLPNALTLLRIAAAPIMTVLIYLFMSSPSVETKASLSMLAASIFLLAALTDWLDGYLARLLKATSDFGAKLDLWADKVIVFAVLLGVLPFQPVIAGIGLVSLSLRDILIMQLRARHPSINLKATFLAKSKTAIVMAGMAICLFAYAFRMYGLNNETQTVITAMTTIQRIGLSVFVFGCVLSLGTGYQYFQATQARP